MKSFVLLVLFALMCVPLQASSGKKNMEHQTVLILLGAPGAGKGTQAVRMSEQYGIPQIATGDLFRENLRLNTLIGQKAKSYMDKGQLVPDELVLDMLFERISKEDCKKGYILDGFPRTIPQAEAFDKRIAQTHAHVIVISLEVPDSIILERLTGRIVCENCSAPYHKTANPSKQPGICDRCGGKLIHRQDDSEEVVRNRLKVFHDQTEPVKQHYQNKNCLVLIDGSVSKENTIAQIETSLQAFLKT